MHEKEVATSVIDWWLQLAILYVTSPLAHARAVWRMGVAFLNVTTPLAHAQWSIDNKYPLIDSGRQRITLPR